MPRVESPKSRNPRASKKLYKASGIELNSNGSHIQSCHLVSLVFGQNYEHLLLVPAHYRRRSFVMPNKADITTILLRIRLWIPMNVRLVSRLGSLGDVATLTLCAPPCYCVCFSLEFCHTQPPDTNAAFFGPAWRYTYIILGLGLLSYPYLPDRSTASMSPTLHPERLTAARSDPSLPLLTRLIARVIPDADHWTERIDRHLALSKQAAEDKLLIQDAQQPKVRRLGIPR